MAQEFQLLVRVKAICFLAFSLMSGTALEFCANSHIQYHILNCTREVNQQIKKVLLTKLIVKILTLLNKKSLCLLSMAGNTYLQEIPLKSTQGILYNRLLAFSELFYIFTEFLT